MTPPVTNFAVREKYQYLEGFGNYHSSVLRPFSRSWQWPLAEI
jgi:hypothetical protein